jgi:hypothetical protein
MQKNHWLYQHIYPKMRYFIGFGRWIFSLAIKLKTSFVIRPQSSKILPDVYNVYNQNTVDSDFDLILLEGELPSDIAGNLYIAQCLGSEGTYMVGDTNIVRIKFDGGRAKLINRKLITPASIARSKLEKSKYRFDFLGLMYLSPGLGIHSYTEGIYLTPAGDIAVTSDIDRPWLVHSQSLRTLTPVGSRREWMPFMDGSAGRILGELFSGYNTSNTFFSDHQSGESFLVNFRLKQADGKHPVNLIRWDGESDFKQWRVTGNDGRDIEIMQSVHELVFTKDYILLADTAFVAGKEMMTPWVDSPKPLKKTMVHIIDRRQLTDSSKTVSSICIEIEKPSIHLQAEFENPGDHITFFMLHTPATNTAETIKEHDRDLHGNYYPDHIIGFGPLPVLDISSLGRHVVSVKSGKVISSKYLSDMHRTWGPYLQTYFNRQLAPYQGQDLFVMFRGFSKDLLPERIFNTYQNTPDRLASLSEMLDHDGLQVNNSICKIDPHKLRIVNSFEFPDRTHLYTIACLNSASGSKPGYILAGVATDERADADSSGHEHWIFNADDLSAGPICKLGHSSLNNSTLFHSLFIPNGVKIKAKGNNYRLSLRDDYPAKELQKWNGEIVSLFEQQIWPYFESEKKTSL